VECLLTTIDATLVEEFPELGVAVEVGVCEAWVEVGVCEVLVEVGVCEVWVEVSVCVVWDVRSLDRAPDGNPPGGCRLVGCR
jgi:hypothetical protein